MKEPRATASGMHASTSRAAATEPAKRPPKYAPLPTEVARRMGAKPVSSSRITAPATMATTTNTANSDMIACVWMMANGLLMLTAPLAPIWIWSTVTEPKVSRKKMAQPTQNTGLLSW